MWSRTRLLDAVASLDGRDWNSDSLSVALRRSMRHTAMAQDPNGISESHNWGI